LKDPWGATSYSGLWRATDTAWTAAEIAKVPFSINPTTSDSKGYFVVPISGFINGFCLSEF
jgi:hypothetical protein